MVWVALVVGPSLGFLVGVVYAAQGEARREVERLRRIMVVLREAVVEAELQEMLKVSSPDQLEEE